jgi:predicted rRNA methylase YqxC with S4 and FtsJ domains
MNKLDNTLPKLFNMLKTAERALKKEKDLVLLVQSSRMSKKNDKKNKGVVSKVKKKKKTY